MKSVVASTVIAIVLAAAGAFAWTTGKTETRLADAHKQLAMLRYADASAATEEVGQGEAVGRLRRLAGDPASDARELRSTADYWSGAYANLAPQRDAAGSITEPDADILLLSANASFRSSQDDPDRNSALRKLDAVVKSYAEVLKRSPNDVDAAFNYEYAVRTRDTLQRARGAARPVGAAVAKNADSDLPAGPTLHGHPGGPPPKTDMAQFKVVIPKRGEERKDDPQAGKGGTKVRKG